MLSAVRQHITVSSTYRVIVTVHSPFYTTYIGGYQVCCWLDKACIQHNQHYLAIIATQVTECMRQVMEPLLFAGGVDLVFAGYVFQILNTDTYLMHAQHNPIITTGTSTHTSVCNLCTTTS